MPSISLATYSIRAIDSGSSQACDDLSQLPGGHDMLDVLSEYFNLRQHDLRRFDDPGTAIRVISSNLNRRSLSGILERGNYGFTSTLFDVEEMEQSYLRSMFEADLLPFYFRCEIPVGRSQGIMALQKFGQLGFKTDLHADLRGYLLERNFPFRIEMQMVVPRSLLDYYFNNGRVLKIRYLRYDAPDDIANALGVEFGEEEASVEFSIKARRNKNLKLQGGWDGFSARRRDVGEFVEIHGVDYQHVKVELEVNGKIRTIDLDNPSEIWAVTDVTERVVTGDDNHPEFESIDHIAQEILGEIREALEVAENVQD